MTVFTRLTDAGANTGPFLVYTDSDGYTTPIFGSPISLASLLIGFTSSAYPNNATIIRLVSQGACDTSIDIPIVTINTTTTTTTINPFNFIIVNNSDRINAIGIVDIITSGIIFPVNHGTSQYGDFSYSEETITLFVSNGQEGCICTTVNGISVDCQNVVPTSTAFLIPVGVVTTDDIIIITINDGNC